MLTLHISNLNYKLKIKHLKYELKGLLTRVVRDVTIKMSHKHPGEAWVKFNNLEDVNTVISLLNDFHFLNRNIKIEKAKKEMIKKKIIIVKDVGLEEYEVIKEVIGNVMGLRYIEPKRVAFIDSDDPENILKILKNDEDLKKCTCEYSK